MRVLLIGPPGAGKGTQAVLLAAHLSIQHISTGDLFREHIDQGTALGQSAHTHLRAGLLAPDDVTIGMIKERLARPDIERGFLLDGFPRNPAQAEALDGILADSGRGWMPYSPWRFPRPRWSGVSPADGCAVRTANTSSTSSTTPCGDGCLRRLRR
nr:nucleoside monophosphate kinase [Streptomyces sp. LBUM 1487]